MSQCLKLLNNFYKHKLLFKLIIFYLYIFNVSKKLINIIQILIYYHGLLNNL